MKASVKVFLDDCIEVEAETVEQAKAMAIQEFIRRYLNKESVEKVWWIEADIHTVHDGDMKGIWA